MLIIPDSIKEYFNEVQSYAQEHGLLATFNQDMLKLHLYGCSWDDPERCRVTPGKDFAPYSFSMSIEMRQEDGQYTPMFNGGVIFHGQHDGFGSGGAPSFSVSLNKSVGWQLHT